jgi:hypothetical protein
VLPFEIDAAAETMDRGDREDWERILKDPADRDPRGFILPSDQPDVQTVRKFVNTLLMNGVEVHWATEAFEVAGTRYPRGSVVVRTDQAFRPHVMDQFEPQQHPNDFAYPGAPPTAPYDNAGWTLAYQMGVQFDRILDGFDGPFERIDAFMLEAEGTRIAGPASNAAGFVVDPRINDAFVLVNRALAAGNAVYRIQDEVTISGGGIDPTILPPGAFFFEGEAQREVLAQGAADTGVPVAAVTSRPAGDAVPLRPIRVGLWDRYGGSMPSGWTRYILEQFEFDYELVFPQEMDAGDLAAKYDVLLFPDGAIPGLEGEGRGRRGGPGPDASEIPAELRDRLGSVTTQTTVPAILDFARQGGTVVAVGTSTALGFHAGLPISDYMVGEDGEPYSREEYFTPGSVHDIKLEHVSPVTHGLGERVDVLHSHSPVFRVEDGAEGVRILAWYDTDSPLKSGWAWGQEKLDGGASMLEADYGAGKLFLFGPKITFRSQSHGTFKLLFNGMMYGAASGRPIS